MSSSASTPDRTVPTAAVSSKPALLSIARAWTAATLTCATLDLTYNIVLWDWVLHRLTVVTLLQFIATGFLGRAAFAGGTSAAVIGLFSHVMVAAIWSAVFVLAHARMEWVRRRPAVAGLALGVIVFAVMNILVVPLSGAPKPVWKWWTFLLNLGAHLTVVGLAISLTAAAVFRRDAARATRRPM